MSTTTKNLSLTLKLINSEDSTDIITRNFSIPFSVDVSVSDNTVKNRVSTLNTSLATNSTTGYGAQAIQQAFREMITQDGDTITYIPKGVQKAEIVTVTEDVIYSV